MNFCIHAIEYWKSVAFIIEYDSGMILVDTGFPGNEQRIVQKMQAIGRDDLRLIFITHAHLDHYGSAAALRRLTGAPVAIHQADAEAMASGKTRLGSTRHHAVFIKALQPFWERLPGLKAEPATPDIVVQDGEDLSSYGINAIVIHTPGHTPGSSCLLVGQNMLFVGDLLSGPRKYPCPQYLYADDWAILAVSIERIRQLHTACFYIGHSMWPRDGKHLRTLTTHKNHN